MEKVDPFRDAEADNMNHSKDVYPTHHHTHIVVGLPRNEVIVLAGMRVQDNVLAFENHVQRKDRAASKTTTTTALSPRLTLI